MKWEVADFLAYQIYTYLSILQFTTQGGFQSNIQDQPVVYQRPKILAENEHFQLLAFGFGRRIERLKMAKCQIAEIVLNGLSPHVTFDDFQKKKMPSTVQNLHLQKQIARQVSKVVPSESNYNSEKKSFHMAEKIRLFARYAKSLLFLHTFVHSASVSVFSLFFLKRKSAKKKCQFTNFFR